MRQAEVNMSPSTETGLGVAVTAGAVLVHVFLLRPMSARAMLRAIVRQTQLDIDKDVEEGYLRLDDPALVTFHEHLELVASQPRQSLWLEPEVDCGHLDSRELLRSYLRRIECAKVTYWTSVMPWRWLFSAPSRRHPLAAGSPRADDDAFSNLTELATLIPFEPQPPPSHEPDQNFAHQSDAFVDVDVNGIVEHDELVRQRLSRLVG
jgi:hypothetical protein